jgi:HlyD family secretion protein
LPLTGHAARDQQIDRAEWATSQMTTVPMRNGHARTLTLPPILLAASFQRLRFRPVAIHCRQGYAQAKRLTPGRSPHKIETLIIACAVAMPEGIVKTNGRLEATQVDVSAKYPGRLAQVKVNEGDEVTAGQVVATIASPETEAQLRNAQAQVLKAKRGLAEANALIVQRKSDLDFAGPDYERARQLVERGNISQQATDSRRNKIEAAQAAYVAANARRDGRCGNQAAEAD